MANDIAAVLRKALGDLTARKTQLDRQISAIQAALGVLGGRERGDGARGRRPMSPAARRAIGKRMKTYWAKRRAGSAKAKTAKKAE
ncbi:MAG: hypothetical protein ACREKH_16745 [Candidatus Rokuibacteriota bacterium]